MAKIATTWDAVKLVIFSNRFKSFYWRTSMMVLAVCIQQLIAFTSTLQLDPTVTVLLGLVLGEVSKFINQSLQQA
jgi:hypothetical protein